MRNGSGPNRLRKHREEAGLVQDDLAQMVGVRSTTISRIERGLFNPSLPVAQALVRVLSKELARSVSMEDLFPEPAEIA